MLQELLELLFGLVRPCRDTAFQFAQFFVGLADVRKVEDAMLPTVGSIDFGRDQVENARVDFAEQRGRMPLVDDLALVALLAEARVEVVVDSALAAMRAAQLECRGSKACLDGAGRGARTWHPSSKTKTT